MNHRFFVGFFAIGIGLLALLQNLQWIQVTQVFLLSILFIVIGILAFVFSRVTPKKSSALILGFLSIFWGVGLLLNELGVIQREYVSIILLIGGGFSFGAIYLNNMAKWWAVIPAGVLLTTGVVSSLDVLFPLNRASYSFLTFFGFSLTFFYLYLIRNEIRQLRWAIYPATVIFFLSMTGLFINSRMNFNQILIGGILILLGLIYIFRFVIYGKSRKVEPESSSPSSELQNQEQS